MADPLDILNPVGHKTFGSPFYGVFHLGGLFGSRSRPAEKQLLPFQQENVATNQQQIPVPYLAGERVVALRWLTGITDVRTKPADSNTKKG
jgi:hypothetical protein